MSANPHVYSGYTSDQVDPQLLAIAPVPDRRLTSSTGGPESVDRLCYRIESQITPLPFSPHKKAYASGPADKTLKHM